jgi:hypothetical protein
MAGPKSDEQSQLQPNGAAAARPANGGNGASASPPPLPTGTSTSRATSTKSAASPVVTRPAAAQSTASQTFSQSDSPDLPPRPRSGPAGPAPLTSTASAALKSPGAAPPAASAAMSTVPTPRPLSRPIPIPRPPGALPVADDDEEEENAATTAVVKSAPPWLVSMVVHMVLLLIMALIVVTQHRNEGIQLFSDRVGDQLALDDLNMEGDDANLEPVEIESSLQEVSDPFAAPPPLDFSLQALKGFTTSSEPAAAPQLALAYSGREEGMRQALSRMYGGDALSDAAVIDGLAWLAKQQRNNGSWSLRGPYTAGSMAENRSSATAMALLAFLGNGNTHIRGTYKAEVDRGVKYLLKIQKADGDFFEGEKRDHWLYSHGQCMIAICELYGMTHDTRLAESAQRAVKFAVEAQHEKGGWRYRPKIMEGDTSVSGWVMMGLQSAKMAGLEVPKEALDRFSGYLDTAQDESGSRYAYLAGAATDEVMTAEALLCRQYLGWSQSDPRLRAGADYLTSPENLPTWSNRNVYYWYYATQMLHHMEGHYWPKWNNIMKPLLVENQVKSGAEAGSWHPMLPETDRWGAFGGRLYVTCLSIYILEVYYRHLPIYADVNKLGLE